MSRVVFVCGPPCSGKTTYAKRLEVEGWVRLSFETEFWRRGIATMPSRDVVDDVKADLKERLLRLVDGGSDIVLDFGFWFRRQREEYRALLAPNGIEPDVVYFPTDLTTALERMKRRRGESVDDWPLTEAETVECYRRFEPPSEDEGPLTLMA